MKKTEPYRPIIRKYPYVRSKKLTQAAKGEVCTFNAPGCDYGSETTIWAHANYDFCGKGAGIKASDPFGCFCCQSCHDLFDGRRHDPLVNVDSLESYFWRAYVKSHNRLIELGIVSYEGAK